MQNIKFKISPWLFLISLLIIPSSLYTILELNSMNDQEKLYKDIYNDQLDAVLFSLNQFADDNVSAWINDIEKLNWTKKTKTLNQLNWIDNNPQCEHLIFIDKIDQTKHLSDTLIKEIQNQVKTNQVEINQLNRYFDEGYRKVLGYDLNYEHYSFFIFIAKLNGQKELCGIIVDARRFISTIFAPRMQRIAGQNLVLSVRHVTSGNIVFSTLINTIPESITEEKVIWLLPDYSIGIQPLGPTIEEVAKKRAYKNILFLIVVDFVLLIGAWFFYRNIKKEIDLAKIKSDFVSNVSHEIRTPLSLISMYAETLQMKRIKEEEKKQKYYGIIYREAQRLSGIVNNILNFSRIENGKRQFNFTSIDINDILNDVMRNYSYQIENKGFKINVKLSDEIPLIKGDEEAISESITNLIDNAIKYSKDIRNIEISTQIMGDKVRLDVKDYGIGISTKEQKHIFNKFYRVTKGSLALHAKGSGLGLSIVKYIMDSHKGNINVKSEENKGSTFSLIFPINTK